MSTATELHSSHFGRLRRRPREPVDERARTTWSGAQTGAKLALGTVGLDAVVALWTAAQLTHAVVSKRKASKEVRRKVRWTVCLVAPFVALGIMTAPVLGVAAAATSYAISVRARSTPKLHKRRMQTHKRRKGPVRSLTRRAVTVRAHVRDGHYVPRHWRGKPRG